MSDLDQTAVKEMCVLGKYCQSNVQSNIQKQMRAKMK